MIELPQYVDSPNPLATNSAASGGSVRDPRPANRRDGGDPAESRSSPELALTDKQTSLLTWLRQAGRVAVAYSGGVDSAVVAQAAALACGQQALAVTANSPSLASGELEAAAALAKQIGIRHFVLQTNEFSNPDYLRNSGDRCFFCKQELYSQIIKQQADLGFEVLVNGANVDDQGDYRPGMQAAKNHSVHSPLIELGFTKSDVRDLARAWNLPVWDKPASPCLSSRIAPGVEVTPERVQRVDAAEVFLRDLLAIRELRVRLESGDLARIEVPLSHIARFADEPTRLAINTRFQQLGFRCTTLDLAGFRSGNLNSLVPLTMLVQTPV